MARFDLGSFLARVINFFWTGQWRLPAGQPDLEKSLGDVGQLSPAPVAGEVYRDEEITQLIADHAGNCSICGCGSA